MTTEKVIVGEAYENRRAGEAFPYVKPLEDHPHSWAGYTGGFWLFAGCNVCKGEKLTPCKCGRLIGLSSSCVYCLFETKGEPVEIKSVRVAESIINPGYSTMTPADQLLTARLELLEKKQDQSQEFIFQAHQRITKLEAENNELRTQLGMLQQNKPVWGESPMKTVAKTMNDMETMRKAIAFAASTLARESWINERQGAETLAPPNVSDDGGILIPKEYTPALEKIMAEEGKKALERVKESNERYRTSIAPSTVTAHFVGGPKAGTSMQMERTPACYVFPVADYGTGELTSAVYDLTITKTLSGIADYRYQYVGETVKIRSKSMDFKVIDCSDPIPTIASSVRQVIEEVQAKAATYQDEPGRTKNDQIRQSLQEAKQSIERKTTSSSVSDTPIIVEEKQEGSWRDRPSLL